MSWRTGWSWGARIVPMLLRTLALVGAIVWLGPGIQGCGGTKDSQVIWDPLYISPRLRPSDVLKDLQIAYKGRNIAEYAKLLADDFTFCFDPDMRPAAPQSCWDRAADSTATARLFTATDISDIRITLTYAGDMPVNEPGKEKWRRIRVTDTFLEVDRPPPVGEVITYRVDGDRQDFYFRKGRNPADTLATSPTAKEWFLVAWNDLGRLNGSAATSAAGPKPAVETTTWGSVKLLFAN